MRKLIFICIITFVPCAHAATVAWNEVMLFKDAGGIKDFYSMMWCNVQLDSGRYFDLQLDMMLTTDSGGFTITSEDYDDTATGVVNNWLPAKKGDMVDASTTRNQSVYFNHCHLDHESGWSNNPIIGELDSDLYLMFAVGDNDGHNNYISNPYCLYGWVHLNVDEQGRMNILSSAIGMEGQSLIVGAIPEPSAGVLLLLGLAALAFRRRRESYAEQFSVEPRFAFAKHGGETCAGPYLAKISENSLKTAAPQGVSPQGAGSSTQRHGGTKAQSVF